MNKMEGERNKIRVTTAKIKQQNTVKKQQKATKDNSKKRKPQQQHKQNKKHKYQTQAQPKSHHNTTNQPQHNKNTGQTPKMEPFRKSWNLQESNEDRDFTPRVGAWHRDSYQHMASVDQLKRFI